MRNGAPGEANSKKKSFPCPLQGDEGRIPLSPKPVRNLSKGKKGNTLLRLPDPSEMDSIPRIEFERLWV